MDPALPASTGASTSFAHWKFYVRQRLQREGRTERRGVRLSPLQNGCRERARAKEER